MSHEERIPQPEEGNETQARAEERPESGTPAEVQSETLPSASEIEALQRKLAEAESKSAEYLEGWQRAQAEFANYKKRIERDNELTYLSMKGEIIKKFLPILDDLERALRTRPENLNGHAWVSGIDLIYRKLQGILEAEGVKRIEAEGAVFDPNFHEALSHEPSEAVPSGHVIAVVQHGYMLGERVLRPALVRVAQ